MTTTSTTLEPTTTNEGFPERFIQVCPSDNFTLFLQASGDAWSCGENSRGQLGNQTTESSLSPFIFGRGFIKLDVGKFHSGGLDTQKRLFLWGDGWHGEQGIDPNTISENVAERFISLPTQRASAVIDFALADARTFLINTGGRILACGENTNGILGTASTETHVRDFELVVTPEDLKFEKINAGIDHFGAIDENGALWMWGSNQYNKLSLPGDPTSVPTKVIDGFVRDVSCGEDFSLVTLTNGRVLAVGSGGWGNVSNWFDVIGEPSRDYALTEVWGSADPDFRERMKIIYADFSEIVLFLDDFYAFKFVPDLASGFRETKLGRIYLRYTAPFIENADGSKDYNRSSFVYINVTFQETGFELYEPLDFTLDGWGSQNGDAVVLSYQVEQLTTTTDEPNQTSTSTTLEPTTSTSTTLEPTTSTSTTSSTTTSTSSTTIDPSTLDSDSDGVNDADDYFFTDSRISETEAQLQTWVSDPDRTLEENSIEPIVIRALRTYDNTLELGKFYLFFRDDYGVIEMTDQDGTSDGSLSADLSARGEGWEVLKPYEEPTTSTSTSTTLEPTTSSTTEEPTTTQDLSLIGNYIYTSTHGSDTATYSIDETGKITFNGGVQQTANLFFEDPIFKIGDTLSVKMVDSPPTDTYLTASTTSRAPNTSGESGIRLRWNSNGTFTARNYVNGTQNQVSFASSFNAVEFVTLYLTRKTATTFSAVFDDGSGVRNLNQTGGTEEQTFSISGLDTSPLFIGVETWDSGLREFIDLQVASTLSTTSTSTTEEPTTTTLPSDPIISSPSGVELYEGAKFLEDGNNPWIITSKIDSSNYILKSQGRSVTIYSGYADSYEWRLEFTGVNCTIHKPHPLSTNQYSRSYNWWVHDGETDSHPYRTSNHDELNHIDFRLQFYNRSAYQPGDTRRGGYLRYVPPNDEALNDTYDANIITPL